MWTKTNLHLKMRVKCCLLSIRGVVYLFEYLNTDILPLALQTYDKRMDLVENEEKHQASEFLLYKFI